MDMFLYTNKGGKDNNEDSAVCCDRDNDKLFMLADGLGGIEGGETASAYVVNSIADSWKRLKTSDMSAEQRAERLTELVISANKGLIAEQEKTNTKMKSTLVALEIGKDLAAWSHVGDTRLYYISDGYIKHITHDHSVAYKKYVSGEISFYDINTDEDQTSLLRCVGDENRCIPETGYSEKLKKGDSFILCTDGAWSNLFSEEILVDCLKSKSCKEWTELLLLRILERITPDNDNLTILTVRV